MAVSDYIRRFDDEEPKADTESIDAKYRKIGSWNTGALRQGFQGFTAGFGDEILAGTRALTTDESYADALASERRLLDEYRQAHRGRAMGEELMGAFAGPGRLGMKAAATPRIAAMTPMGQGAILGGAEGAVMGAGYADGRNIISEIGSNALLGTALGVGGAWALPLISQGLGSFGGGIKRAFSTPEGRALDRISSVARDMEVPTSASMAELNALGPDARLTDLQGYRDVGEALAQTPSQRGRFESALTARNLPQNERLVRDINSIAGVESGGINYWGKLDEIRRTQSQVAKRAYDEANAIEVPPNDTLFAILDTPAAGKAWNQARRRLANQPFSGRKLNDFFEISLDADGNIIGLKVTKTPDMQAWNDIKRGLDDLIEKETKGEFMHRVTPEGRDYVILKKALTDELDAANPAYKAARQGYAQAERLKESAELGRREIFRMDPWVMEQRVNGMSPPEYDAFRAGVLKAIEDKLAKKSRRLDLTKNFLESPESEAQIANLFRKGPNGEVDQEAIDALNGLLHRERTMYGTNAQLLGNSATDRRLQAREMLSRGGVTVDNGLMSRVVRSLSSAGKPLPPEDLSAMTDLLLKEDPAQVLRQIESMGVDAATLARAERWLRTLSTAGAANAAAAYPPLEHYLMP